MATLQVCYKDASGNLKCYPPSTTMMMNLQADTTAVADTSTAASTATAAVAGKKNLKEIVEQIRDLVHDAGKDGEVPDVVSILYIA